MIINIFEFTSDFAENKDVARALRLERIVPELVRGEIVVLDFLNVTSATQSFIHALISQIIRDNGIAILEKLHFKNCNEKIKTIIEIVVDYIQDGIFSEEEEDEK